MESEGNEGVIAPSPTSFLKRIALGRLADNSPEGVGEELLLRGIGEAAVAMTHVEIYHAILVVGAQHGAVRQKNSVP